MKHRNLRRPDSTNASDLALLFASPCRSDGFPAFLRGLRQGEPRSIDDLASAHRLYLFMGELVNRK